MGAFLVSGLLHYIALLGMGKGTELKVIASFVMMGFGAILEGVWKKMTGHRVGGLLGWIWAVIWSIPWGTLAIDAWAKKGMVRNSTLIPIRPSKWVVERVINWYLE